MVLLYTDYKFALLRYVTLKDFVEEAVNYFPFFGPKQIKAHFQARLQKYTRNMVINASTAARVFILLSLPSK